MFTEQNIIAIFNLQAFFFFFYQGLEIIYLDLANFQHLWSRIFSHSKAAGKCCENQILSGSFVNKAEYFVRKISENHAPIWPQITHY